MESYIGKNGTFALMKNLNLEKVFRTSGTDFPCGDFPCDWFEQGNGIQLREDADGL